MPIFKVIKNDDVFVAHKQPFQDENLSLEAIGLVGFFVSHNDGWTIRQSDLYKIWKEKTVRSALKELEQAGYVNRARVNLYPPGNYDWLIEIFETPEHKQKSVDEFLNKFGGSS